MGKIKIIRTKNHLEAASYCVYNIYLDGNKIDFIMAGEIKVIDISTGIHSLYVRDKFNICISNTLVLNINESEILEIEVGSWIYGWKIIFACFIALFTPVVFFARSKARQTI